MLPLVRRQFIAARGDGHGPADVALRGSASVLRRVVLIVALVGLLLPLTLPAEAGPNAPPGRVAGQVLVRFLDGTGPADVASAQRALGAREVGVVEQLGVRVWQVPAQASERALVALQRNPRVEFAELDGVVEAEELLPNDPAYGDQWGLQRVNAPTAWATTTGDPEVVIAILDTGVAVPTDLVGKVLPGYNAIDLSTNTSDVNGHGTRAASVASAATDNGIGIAGYCWTCRLLPVKVLSDTGSGTMSDLARGITWAADSGADVISMSLSGASGTAVVASAVRYAQDRGVVLVAAAGNQGSTELRYPAAYPEVLAVAGTDSRDRFYSWSNRGSWVDVSAPGVNQAITQSGEVTSYAGTSSATPAVAGVVGLGLSTGADATAVVDALRSTAQPISGIAHGRVDAAALVDSFSEPPVPGPEPDPEPPAPDPDPEPDPDPDPEPPAPEPFALTLTASTVTGGPTWTAAVTFAITEAGGPVVGLRMAARWSGGTSGTDSCVTGDDGRCTLSASGIPNRNKTATLTVTGIGGASTDGPSLTVSR